MPTAIVFLPRARCRGRSASPPPAPRLPGGLILVDGLKTDGIEPMLKACRAPRRCAGADLQGAWQGVSGSPRRTVSRTGRAPSPARTPTATSPRPACSRPMASIRPRQRWPPPCPPRSAQSVADLGAGWGYLSAQILSRRRNRRAAPGRGRAYRARLRPRQSSTDARAKFHWADAPAGNRPSGWTRW